MFLAAAVRPAVCAEESVLKKELPADATEFVNQMRAKLAAEAKTTYDEAKKRVKALETEVSRLRAELQRTTVGREAKEARLTLLEESLASEKSALDSAWLFHKGLESHAAGEKLYNALKDTYSKIDELGKEWEQHGGSLAPTSFLPSEINVTELTSSSGIRNTALGAYQYYQKINALRGDLDAIAKRGYSESTGKLVGSLSVLSTALSEFGGKVPLLGDFLKAYGDVTKEFLNAVFRLEDRIQKNRNQVFSPTSEGTYGGGGMRQAWTEQGIKASGMQARVQGLRDVYAVNHQELYIWDPQSYRQVGDEIKPGRWWEVHKFSETGGRRLNLDLLMKRYTAYFRNGNQNPTAQQVLFEFSKAVELKLSADVPGVAPGGKLTVTPTAIRVFNNTSPDPPVVFSLYDARHPGTKKSCKLGESLEWVAPDQNGAYVLVAELDEATKRHWYQIAPARLHFNVGLPTMFKLAVSEQRIPTTWKKPVGIDILVAGADASDVTKGEIQISPIAGGSLSRSYFSPEDIKTQSRFREVWTPYDFKELEPGVRTIEAKYTCPPYETPYQAPATISRSLVVFKEYPTRFVIRRTPEAEGGVWVVGVQVHDVKQHQVLRIGLVTLTTDKGHFMQEGRAVPTLTVPAGDVTARWHPPEPLEGLATVTVSYSGFPGEGGDLAAYAPIPGQTFTLPAHAVRRTRITAGARRQQETKKWTITIQPCMDLQTNRPVPAGTMEVTVDRGGFSSHDNKRTLDLPAGQASVLVWDEPDALSEQAGLNIVYPETTHEAITYETSSAALRLPETLLADTEIVVQKRHEEGPPARWTLTASVIDAAGNPVRQGRLVVSGSTGTLDGQSRALTFDLAERSAAAFRWEKGAEATAATITLKYAGDGAGAGGANIRFHPCVRTDTLAPVEGRLVVIVKDRASGAPVPGATVNLICHDTQPSAVTDANGTAVFERLSPGFVYVSAIKPGYLPAAPSQVETRLGPEESTMTRTLTVSLVQGMRVDLLVKNEQGELLPSASASMDQTVMVSAPSGRARFEPVSRGSHVFEAWARGYARASVAYEADPERAAQAQPGAAARDTLALTLAPGRTIAVEVRNALNELIPANITLYRGETMVAQASGPTALFPVTEDGAYHAKATAPGHAPGTSGTTVLAPGGIPHHADLTVKLQATARTAVVRIGVQVDASRASAPGAVIIRMAGPSGLFMEADDVAVFRGVGDGTHRITASRRGLKPVSKTLAVAATTPDQVYDVQLVLSEPQPLPGGAGESNAMATAIKNAVVASGLRPGSGKLEVEDLFKTLQTLEQKRAYMMLATMDRSVMQMGEDRLPTAVYGLNGPLVSGRVMLNVSCSVFQADPAARRYYEKSARAGTRFLNEMRRDTTDPEKDGGFGKMMSMFFSSVDLKNTSTTFHGMPAHLMESDSGNKGPMAQFSMITAKGFSLLWLQGRTVVAVTGSSFGAGGEKALIRVTGPPPQLPVKTVYRLGDNLYRELSLLPQFEDGP